MISNSEVFGGLMNTEELIKKLKSSNLYAECPCGEEFKLSDALLFDGTKPFPAEALKVQELLKEEFKKREENLVKQKKLTTEKAKITAESVNIGKKVEVLLPTFKEFKWVLPDCRFLGEPLDLITFNGLSISKVNSISFIEVKSGGARLNDHQKAIKAAVEDKNVSYQVFK